ncbi:MAG: thiamine pyrophosphate-dependent dehydrogenase E1 component subunit alpha [Simkaniaceae bacterium]|nr:thiamine pyrophosphate-dependent dehydrogenase E1 component subunit alpha [Simkaniaceae bacterium]
MNAIDLFFKMLRIRRIEEAIAARYSEQKMRCPTYLSIGQEGVAVGVSEALKDEDLVMSTHRCHAHYLARGGDLKKMLAELHGKKTGCSLGRGGSVHLIDLSVGMMGATPIAGGGIPIATGLAFTSRLKNDKKITASFFGEGATEEGAFAESLNFATLKNLPILFVCENNLYSMHSPINIRQALTRDRVKIAEAHGMFAKRGNGNNVEETYQLALDAVASIRSGNGPSYIELDTYRLCEHCGPNFDTDLGYRSEEEFNNWLDKCPIKTYRDKLLTEKVATDHELDALEMTIEEEIKDAFIFAKESPYPQFDLDYEWAYAE